MDNTEFTNDTLKDRAWKAAATMLFDGGSMTVNDWDALQAYASHKLLEIDMEDTGHCNEPLTASDLRDM